MKNTDYKPLSKNDISINQTSRASIKEYLKRSSEAVKIIEQNKSLGISI